MGQAQDLNYLMIKIQIELQRRFEECQMDFYHALNMQNLKNNSLPVAEATIPISANNFPEDELKKLINEFVIEKKALKKIAVDVNGEWLYQLRNEELNRHLDFQESQLVKCFKNWLYLKIDERIEDISSKAMDRLGMKLKRKIPDVNNGNIVHLKESQLRFNNGVYDIMEDEFYDYSYADNIYNKFSIRTTKRMQNRLYLICCSMILQETMSK